MNSESPLTPTRDAFPASWLRRIALALAAVFGALFVVGVVPRLLLHHRLGTEADAVRDRLRMFG